jgi:predicted nucleotidyltransferase
VIDLLADNLDEIARLCRQYGIKRLDVYGSAATGAFDPDASDIDIVVDLGEYDDDVHVRYLDLIADLEALLGSPVSMLTRPSIRNPYLRESIQEQQELVYEAGDRQAAA